MYIYICICTGTSMPETDPADVPVGSVSPCQQIGGTTTQKLFFTHDQANEERSPPATGGETPPLASSRGGKGQSDLHKDKPKDPLQMTHRCNLPGGAPSPQQDNQPEHTLGK